MILWMQKKVFIAMSSFEDYLKIKCNENSNVNNLSIFTASVNHLTDNYKLVLKKIDNKNTYRIIGHN